MYREGDKARAMRWVDDLRMHARFAWGLRGFLRHPLSLPEARAIVQQRLDERETNFLRTVERGIFGYPRSPYLPLLKLAACEFGDLQRLVRTRGARAHAGRPARRWRVRDLRGVQGPGARRAAGTDHSHRGSRLRQSVHARVLPGPIRRYDGAGTRVDIDLEHLADRAANYMIAYHVHGVLHAPTAIWYGVLPDGTGVGNLLEDR
jgi:hypothetical protein